MKKVILSLLIIFMVLGANSQVDFTMNPITQDISGAVHFKVHKIITIGACFDVNFKEGYNSIMADARFRIYEYDKKEKKLNFILHNGYSLGADWEGIATAYYFTEQFYFNNYPLGIILYQRVYVGAESGVDWQPRIGIVWNFYKKQNKTKTK